ncbi:MULTISPECIES: trans-aconitate 2-methyltransferase [Streptomyces]|uniref:class I SAM-dependent methyltransferase n=1 Tax=Streptomyces TaxID=1883 RepID=UPI00068DCA69|nr:MULTISPECIES: class I SAM-dependent methyltransferase [Streptomyces]
MHDTHHTHHTHHSHDPHPFDWDAVYRGDGSDTTAPDPLLLAPADALTPGRALDLGCGAGGNALALAERGWRVTGVDIAPRAIAGTRAGACARGLELELLVADTAQWRPETTYGFVLSSYALPPRGPARTATLAAAAAALAPGGILALGEWDEEGCDWGADGDLVTLEEIRTHLSDLGLDIVCAERLRVPRHRHPGHEQEPADDAAVIVTARKPHDTLETSD